MINFIKAITNPDKYSVDLPINKIIADNKVDKKWIQELTDNINSGKTLKSIVVVKHPDKDYFAIKCAVVNDFIGLGFFLTKEGIFQPNPKITKYIRIPIKRFNRYIYEFVKNPEKLLKKN
jgi:hypothetical protein